MRSTKARARNAPGSAMAPINSAKASTCAVTTPASPNTEILMILVAAEIGEDRGDRDDRHNGLGADQRHQHQRHQRAGAVAGQPPDDGRKQRDTGNQQKLQQRDLGETGDDIHSRLSRVKRVTVWSAMASSAA